MVPQRYDGHRYFTILQIHVLVIKYHVFTYTLIYTTEFLRPSKPNPPILWNSNLFALEQVLEHLCRAVALVLSVLDNS